jgi:SAM-dependent methyltransferase
MPDGDDALGPDCWWADFFTGEHAEFQIALTEETHDSDAETDLLIRLGHVSAGARVLDIPCGQGRHAIRLARLGADVTGVDASQAMLDRARRDAQDAAVHVSWIQSDMRQFACAAPYDFLMCLGGSFGYFGRSGDQAFLRTLWRSLKPGGILALDVPSLEYIREHHNPRHESVLHSRRVIQQRRLDPDSGAARIDVVTISERGRTPRVYYQQLYRIDEIQGMLADAGFEVRETLDATNVPEYRSNVGHVLLVAPRR